MFRQGFSLLTILIVRAEKKEREKELILMSLGKKKWSMGLACIVLLEKTTKTLMVSN